MSRISLGRQQVLLDQQRRAVEQRIALLVRLDLRLGEIGAPARRSRHGRRAARNPCAGRRACARVRAIARGLARAAIGVDHVEAAAMDIFERRPVLERGLDPAARRPRRNADAIVLAQEDERHRRALIGGPGGGVERALRGRMVGRGVAEAGEHDRIARQRRVLELQHPGDADAERRADRLGQMRGDGAGLRRDVERLRADHLVPAAGNRVLGRGGEAQQHVPAGRLPGQLLRAVDLEGVRAVVEEGHVVEPQRLGDRGIVLMARAADRVEALAARLQPAREPVHLAADALAVEQLDHRLAARGRPRPGATATRRRRQLAAARPWRRISREWPRRRPSRAA